MVDVVQIDFNRDDLFAALQSFRADVSNKVTRQALRNSANDALKQLQAAAPHRTGRLSNALAVRTTYAGARGIMKADVTIRTIGTAKNPSNAFYWRFLEYGHRTRPDREGQSRGKVPPLYFIRNTWLRIQLGIGGNFFAALGAGVDKTYNQAS